MSDITAFSFLSTAPSGDVPPKLTISVSLSSDFSHTGYISVLYWAINHEQTWVGLARVPGTQDFIGEFTLSTYARSGTYEIRAIQMTDDTGVLLRLSDSQLVERGFDTTTELVNPNADMAAPVVNAVQLGQPTVDAQGNIHVRVNVDAADQGSGLKKPFIVEFTSPTGKSLQQWAALDDAGHASVDFLLDPFSASGAYRINTIRIEDLAGNLTFGDGFLASHPQSVVIDNPLSDAVLPQLDDFRLSAVFDPQTNRPKIMIEGTAEDQNSGISGAYLRLWSPAGSGGGNLDDWLSWTPGSEGTKKVQLHDYIALPTDFSPGEYTVGYAMLQDRAGNEMRLSQDQLESLGFAGRVRVYFPEVLTGSTNVHGSDNGDYVFGSDTTNDMLYGGAGDDYLYSGKGDDVVDAGQGNDLIVGGDGAGNDTYIGGVGIDTIRYTSAITGITVDLTAGTASGKEINQDKLFQIENIIGGQSGDILKGDGQANRIEGYLGDDIINGGGGNDTLVGGLGNDLYYVDAAGDVVIEAANEGIDSVYSYLAGYTLAANVENGRIVSTGAANLTGNALNNMLYAGTGNNVIDGGDGIDTVSFYYGVTGSAGVTANLVTGKATGSGTDTLVNIERLYGSENADRFTGDTRANILYTYGGDDFLDGGAGADTMIGGLGNDLYYVDAAGDVVVEAANEGIDSVYSYLGAYTLAANVENGRILSGSWANLTGNALDNFLYAGTGNNAINGGDGIDTVSFYYGVTGTSGVTASLLTGKATGSGSDTLTNVERLYGTENADSFTGDAKANTLYTYGGNDILDGGLGNDVLTGGAGADAFVFSTALNGTANVDRITDFVAGTDTIRLENAVFTKLANTGTLGANNFKVIGSAPLDADDFILYDKASGYLYYDADGSGAGAAVKFALVGVNLSLTYADFTVM